MRRLESNVHRGIQKMLNKEMMEEWDVLLCEVMFAYNKSIHSTTRLTAYFLKFRVETPIPNEILVGLHEMERTPAAYAFQRYQELGVAYEAGRECTDTAEKMAKDYYDIGAIQKKLQVGDNVRIAITMLNDPFPQNCIANGPNFIEL